MSNRIKIVKTLKNPISKKNKLKLYYFNLKNTTAGGSFRTSILRYSNTLTTDFKISKSTLLEINKKKKIFSFCKTFIKSNNWFVLDLILDNLNLEFEINQFKTYLNKFFTCKMKIITVDKTILNYIKSFLHSNNTTKDFFLKKNLSDINLKVLPFSKNLDSLSKKYLSFVSTLPEHLKLLFFTKSTKSDLFNISSFFSTQKLIILFEEELTFNQLKKIYFYFDTLKKVTNFFFFFFF